jgi:hypothetical protein
VTRRRLPRTLVGGRVRTSTVFLLVAFVGVLTLWVSVRPTTASTTEEVLVRHTTSKKTAVTDEEEQDRRAVPIAPRRVTPSPTATPTPTPTATAIATALPKGKQGKNAPGALPVAPPPTAGPTDSAAPSGSLSQILPPDQTAPPG